MCCATAYGKIMSTQEGKEEHKGHNGHKGYKTEGDAPEVEPKGKLNGYQLYRDNEKPCNWYLSVDGQDAQPISPMELGQQIRFRNWHWKLGFKPPRSGDRKVFEEFIDQLYDAAVKRETLPFMQTDAGHVENLAQYFSIHIPNKVRAFGQEFLDGKTGDPVRIRLDIGRVHFKWQQLKRYCQTGLNAREEDIRSLERFIDRKGGYQSEKEGRGWFRCTYWVPWRVFDEITRERWLNPDKPDEGEGNV